MNHALRCASRKRGLALVGRRHPPHCCREVNVASPPPRTTEERPQAVSSGITVISVRFSFDVRKSRRLRANPRRGIGFEEARELFSRPYWLDRRSDVPEQFLAIGWVGDRLFSVIFEVSEDEEGEILHLVTLWRSTKEEIKLYEENS